YFWIASIANDKLVTLGQNRAEVSAFAQRKDIYVFDLNGDLREPHKIVGDFKDVVVTPEGQIAALRVKGDGIELVIFDQENNERSTIKTNFSKFSTSGLVVLADGRIVITGSLNEGTLPSPLNSPMGQLTIIDPTDKTSTITHNLKYQGEWISPDVVERA